ncbi:hypothetical protein FZD47_20315 [Bacillus infantis]|uniref:HPr kinase/phosphorylase C-terminal domain-containing protein n=1 Tax=Bacillus infantis TaxID=324767 RepID=A0A5D4SC54_9BACI|nr:hypothetical protein [Bacillus infantis]TYS60559.1 hypothetical protein FZD47_20315 [Bacillus infantis]
MFTVDIAHKDFRFRLLTDSLEIYNEISPRVYSVPGGKSYGQKQVDVTISFFNKLIIINKNGENEYIHLDYTEKEIYPVIFSEIYKYLFNIGSIGIHSVLVSKSNRNHLIIGDFGQGKTTLATELEKNDFKILSCDQSEIKYLNKKVYALSGSKLNKLSGTSTIIKDDIKTPLEIDTIYKVKGLSYGGLPIFNKVTDNSNKVFNLWPAITWPWQNPILSAYTDNMEWKNYRVNCIKACTTLSVISQIELRGDPSLIAKKISQKVPILN